jgi:hypothetical protein
LNTGRKFFFLSDLLAVVVLAVLVVMGVVAVITLLVAVNGTSRFPLSVESSGGAVHISAWRPDILPRIFIVLSKSV